jgi:hypothetical protein
LNSRPQLCYHARGPSLSQSNHKTQVIWKGREALLSRFNIPLLICQLGSTYTRGFWVYWSVLEQ